MENEVWKDIPEYEGLYQASNLGRIRSVDRIVEFADGRYHTYKGIILSQFKSRKYLRVIVSKDNNSHKLYVHRLVWSAFNGQIPNCMQINHIDENPSNNRLENLELVTPKENLTWGTRIWRVCYKNKKPVIQYTLDGKFVKEWDSIKSITSAFNYKESSISLVCNGRRKSCYNYIWKFKL